MSSSENLKNKVILELIPPTGDAFKNPSQAILESVLLNDDPTYWQSGSQDAGLHSHIDNKVGDYMIFTFHQGKGFCTTYWNDDEEPRILTGIGSPADTSEIKVQQGNTLTVPYSYFSSSSDTLKAALYFVNHHGRWPDGNWQEYDPQ